MTSLAKKILCLWLVFVAVALGETEDNTNVHDNSRIALFLQPGISFLGFDQREYFQDAIDTIYHEFLSQALDKRDTANVAKQDFQKVNFCFPIYAGLQFQLRQDNFLSVGAGYIYDNESVVLSDQNSRSHNYSYTLQGFPLFLEYRFAIPLNLMSLSNESLFSVALRWYWVLPHTEIYTSWGSLSAETPYYGAGFGISIGYLLFNWKSLYVFGDLGYSSISVKSKKQYADIVPDGPEEKAKWNIGGIQLQIRVSLGVWNKPEVVEDSTVTDSLKKSSSAKGKDSVAVVAKDSTAVSAKDGATVTTKKDAATIATKDTVAAVAKDSAAVSKDSTAATTSKENAAPAPARPEAETRPNAEARPNAAARPSAEARPE